MAARLTTAELDSRYGPLRVPAGDDMIARFLARFGEWAWLEAEFVAGLLRPGARIADGGAFLGTFGLGVALCTPLESLCFVEANPDLVPLLRENVERCCRAPGRVVSALLAPPGRDPAPGIVAPGNLGSASYVGALAADEPPPLPAPAPAATLGLRQFASDYGPFDLIKLDVEGMELPLLAAERGSVAALGCAFWLECNETPGSLALADLLAGAGFDLWYYAFPAFNPSNFARHTEPIFPFAYEAALLALPRKRRRSRVSLPMAKPRPGCIFRRVASGAALKEALWLTPRFAPPGWDTRTREEIVALSMHLMVGEDYASYLAGGRGHEWASPFKRADAKLMQAHQEIEMLRAQLAEKTGRRKRPGSRAEPAGPSRSGVG